MYDIVILDEAKEELRCEMAYSREKWGPTHGEKYAKELQEQIRALRNNPRLYPLRNDILPDIRIKTFKGNQIIYTIRENLNSVVVLAVISRYQQPNQVEPRLGKIPLR